MKSIVLGKKWMLFCVKVLIKMSINCKITFQNRDKVFIAGQLLRGIVHLTLARGTTVRRIHVQLYGRGQTHWRLRIPGLYSELCNGKEVYLDEITSLSYDRDGELIIIKNNQLR